MTDKEKREADALKAYKENLPKQHWPGDLTEYEKRIDDPDLQRISTKSEVKKGPA